MLTDQCVVAREAPTGEEHAPRQDLDRAPPLGTHRDAAHGAVVAHEPLDDGTGADGHVRVARNRAREVGEERGTAPLAREVEAGNGVTRGHVRGEQLDPSPAAVREPGDERSSLLGERGGDLRRQLVVCGRAHVFCEARGVVRDPRVALEAAARCGQHLGFARGAAAELSPALEDDGAAPAVGRHDRSGEAANARSHHQQVTFLLPGASGHARP